MPLKIAGRDHFLAWRSTENDMSCSLSFGCGPDPHTERFKRFIRDKTNESVVIQVWWPDSTRASPDVDEREPRPLRPEQIALSERPDRRRMEAGRAFDPTRQAWRRQADGRHARGGERPDVHSVHRLPVARDPEGPAPKSTVYDYFDLWTYDGTLGRMHHALYQQCREQEQREASPTAAIIDSQSVKSAEKGGPASTRMAMMRARRSRARSGTFSSIR